MFTKKKWERLDKITKEITSVERPDILGDQYLEKSIDFLRRYDAEKGLSNIQYMG